MRSLRRNNVIMNRSQGRAFCDRQKLIHNDVNLCGGLWKCWWINHDREFYKSVRVQLVEPSMSEKGFPSVKVITNGHDSMFIVQPKLISAKAPCGDMQETFKMCWSRSGK